MNDDVLKADNLLRLFVVLLIGILLYFVLSVGLERLLHPNFSHLIVEAQRSSTGDPNWNRVWGQLQHSAFVTTYVGDPLVGLGIGLFVGLVEKRRHLVIVVLCLLPGFMIELLTDHRRNWATSGYGILQFFFHRSLPFLTGIAAAVLTRYVISQRRQPHVATYGKA